MQVSLFSPPAPLVPTCYADVRERPCALRPVPRNACWQVIVGEWKNFMKQWLSRCIPQGLTFNFFLVTINLLMLTDVSVRSFVCVCVCVCVSVCVHLICVVKMCSNHPYLYIIIFFFFLKGAEEYFCFYPLPKHRSVWRHLINISALIPKISYLPLTNNKQVNNK